MIYLIIDIETSGFNKVSDEILEVGYLRVNEDLQILGADNFYFYKPGWKVGPTDIHGLTEEFLLEHTSEFDESLAKLYAVYRDSAIIGKNSKRFDEPFIKSFIQKHGTERMSTAESKMYLDLQDWCTPHYQDAYQKKYGVSTTKKGTLEQLVETVVGISLEDATELYKQQLPEFTERVRPHAALYDAFLTYLVLVDCKSRRGLKM